MTFEDDKEPFNYLLRCEDNTNENDKVYLFPINE